MREARVCVVGSCTIDLIAKVPRLPAVGETLLGESFHLGPGGKGANQAVMARRMGASVQLVGKVGEDIFGEMLLENLRAEGVDCAYVGRAPGASGVAPIFVDPEGRNLIAAILGANLKLTPDDVLAAHAAFAAADIVVLQNEVPLESTLGALQLARAVGARTVWNPAPAIGVPVDALGLANVLVVNEPEAEQLTGQSVAEGAERDAAARLRRLGARTVIITLGARGAWLDSGELSRRLPGEQVQPVDTTGAGDAFTGALAVALARSHGLERAVQLANIAGALATTRVGTQVAFPEGAEVERWWRQRHGGPAGSAG